MNLNISLLASEAQTGGSAAFVLICFKSQHWHNKRKKHIYLSMSCCIKTSLKTTRLLKIKIQTQRQLPDMWLRQEADMTPETRHNGDFLLLWRYFQWIGKPLNVVMYVIFYVFIYFSFFGLIYFLFRKLKNDPYETDQYRHCPPIGPLGRNMLGPTAAVGSY